MESLRYKKVSASYHQEICKLVYHEMKEPRLAGIVITRVVMTPDLRLARIYFTSPQGLEKAVDTIRAFKKSRGYLRHVLATRIPLRFTPDLEFFYDEQDEHVQELEALFRQIQNEKKQSP